METTTLILGCGYTGRRVARSLLAGGHAVVVTTRRADRLADLGALGADVRTLDLAQAPSTTALIDGLPSRLRVVHSLPPWRGDGAGADPTRALLEALAPRVRRWVYLSSTGVYGAVRDVDAETEAAPETAQQRARRAAEHLVCEQAAPTLVLRAPAIYGPHRGVHALMRAGRYRLVGAGENVGSRIHVDDLAAHVEAGLATDHAGAWPTGDALPAKAADVASFCARLLDLPPPPSVRPEDVGETQRVTRRVDGSAIRGLLGLRLRYPTYREGIVAALAAEAGA